MDDKIAKKNRNLIIDWKSEKERNSFKKRKEKKKAQNLT